MYFRVLLLFFCAFEFSTAMADSTVCAKFKLQNDSFDIKRTAAEECGLLIGVFDLSMCSDKKMTNGPKITCVGETAIASVNTRSSRYEIKIKRIVGQRGNVLWDPAGEVQQFAISQMQKRALVPKVAVQAMNLNPSRGPASVRNMNESIQSAQAIAPAAKPEQTPIAADQIVPKIPPTLSISGLFDVYYAQNFNHPKTLDAPTTASPGLPNQQNGFRNYDLYSNQVALNLAEVTIKNTGKETTLLVDLDFGQQADYISRSPTGATDDVSKNIGQALLTYTPESAPRLSFNIGKMYSNMGYETPKAINNWQYSRSFLYSLGLPAWHVGASVSYVVAPDLLTATVYAYNGWNTIYNSSSSQDYAAQLTLTPNKSVSLTYNGITGPVESSDTSSRNIQVHEIIATWNPSVKSQIAWDSIYGHASHSSLGLASAEWIASSVAFKYQATPWYSISPRLEFFKDGQGFTSGTAQDLSSLTITQATKLKDGLEPRLELRWDHSSAASFETNRGNDKDQLTVLLAAIYGF